MICCPNCGHSVPDNYCDHNDYCPNCKFNLWKYQYVWKTDEERTAAVARYRENLNEKQESETPSEAVKSLMAGKTKFVPRKVVFKKSPLPESVQKAMRIASQVGMAKEAARMRQSVIDENEEKTKQKNALPDDVEKLKAMVIEGDDGGLGERINPEERLRKLLGKVQNCMEKLDLSPGAVASRLGANCFLECFWAYGCALTLLTGVINYVISGGENSSVGFISNNLLLVSGNDISSQCARGAIMTLVSTVTSLVQLYLGVRAAGTKGFWWVSLGMISVVIVVSVIVGVGVGIQQGQSQDRSTYRSSYYGY